MKAASFRFLQICVVLIAIAFIALFFYTALPRLHYPYDLDFIEDSMLIQSLRIAEGQPVYLPPNAEFNPHVYMPLFFWLGAILFKIGGPSLFLLRLISLSATLTTTVLIYLIALRESGLRWIAIACAGLFLGGYRINGFWYEVARVDSLFIALMLAGFALAIYAGSSNWRLVLSAVFIASAAFTKQTGFLVAIGFSLYLLIKIRRRAWIFLLAFGALAVIPLFVLNRSTNGWFFYHIFYIGSADPVEIRRLINFLTKELFGIVTGLSVLALLAVILGVWRSGPKVLREQPWLFAIGMALIISSLGRMRVGGNLNNRMPAYALLCIAPAIWMQMSPDNRIRKESAIPWRNWVAISLILLQFWLGRYDPKRFIPTSSMRKSGDDLIQQIGSLSGPIFVMMHPYYTLMAGKEPSSQMATIWYVRHRGELPLPNDFVRRIQNHYYSAIISDESFFETQPDL
ncbi:MAG TPA: glycosyltransferase family 39 protein, partial [Anaerolineales bacterium]|nr:glycosyltransferase family 39 protein [Anaerolineales bacterium]